MAARTTQYHVVEDESGAIGLYVCKTPQQALAYHTRPLVARRIPIEDAMQLITQGNMVAVVVPSADAQHTLDLAQAKVSK